MVAVVVLVIPGVAVVLAVDLERLAIRILEVSGVVMVVMENILEITVVQVNK